MGAPVIFGVGYISYQPGHLDPRLLFCPGPPGLGNCKNVDSCRMKAIKEIIAGVKKDRPLR